MENPKDDYVIGLHVMPYIESGTVELKYGKLNASSDEVIITIKGLTGHGAYPEKAIDAIVIAGHVIVALQTIVSRNISPINSLVLSLGTINGGIKENIISDQVKITGTLRSLDSETRQYAKDRIKSIVENVSLSLGGKGEVLINEGYEPLINNDEVVNIIKDTAERVLGKDKIIHKEIPSLGAEDFSYFSNRAKGAFYHLGCGNKEKGITNSIYKCRFEIDEACLKTGVLLQVENALAILKASTDKSKI